jgi:hypothetical protein
MNLVRKDGLSFRAEPLTLELRSFRLGPLTGCEVCKEVSSKSFHSASNQGPWSNSRRLDGALQVVIRSEESKASTSTVMDVVIFLVGF